MRKWLMEQGEDAWLLQQAGAAFLGARSDMTAPLALGVAVSGGGDSIALLHLLHRVAPHTRFDLRAVTVDHGLRAGSASEAAQVAAFCNGLGLPHETLTWQGPEPSGNLMDQARRARASLIADWARGHGIGHVALGHTADDQAESFLMNLGRSAGLDGLSGMRLTWSDRDVTWTRPLTEVPRAALRAYLARAGLTWIDDPTNEDDRFARVRARKALAALAPLGITVAGLATTISHLSSAQTALQGAAHLVAGQIEETGGALSMRRDLLLGQPEDITRRLLLGMIGWMNGRAYAPREAKMFALTRALTERRDATLGGVRFQCREGEIKVIREARAVMGAVLPGSIWDHRWQMTGPAQTGLTIGPLGPEGLRQFPGWRDSGVSRAALLVSPAVWADQALIAAPIAGFGQGWNATLTSSFRLFLISH